MSQCSKFEYMTQDQVRELRGLNTSKIPASHYSQPVTYASGFSVNHYLAPKGDSDDEGEEESSQGEQNSDKEESSADIQDGSAAADPEESSQDESDAAVDSEQEPENDTLDDRADESTENGPRSILKSPDRSGSSTHDRNVSFVANTHDSNREPKQNCRDTFRTGESGRRVKFTKLRDGRGAYARRRS